MTDLDRAVVLITGAGGGFGRQMTRQFLAQGSLLILHDLHPERVQAARDEIAGDSVEELGITVSTVYPWFSRTAILDSEHFGPDEKSEIPDDMVTDPAEVVAQMLDGIRDGRQHIFPDKMSRRIQFMKRHFPRTFRRLGRRLELKMRAEPQAGQHRQL